MAKHRSGSARRRARRIRELEDNLSSEQQRSTDGGDAIDLAVTALSALRGILGIANERQLELKGDEMACLLSLITNEIEAGRAVQTHHSHD